MVVQEQKSGEKLAIRADLIGALYATPASILIGCLTVTSLMVAAGAVSGDRAFFVQAAIMGMIGLGRHIAHLRYSIWKQQRAQSQSVEKLKDDLDFFERLAMAGAWATALTVSGFGAYCIVAHAGEPVMVLGLAQTVGYLAGVSSRNTSSPIIPRVQVVLASVPTCLALLATGSIVYGLIGLSVALAAFLTFSSAQTIYDAVLVRHQTLQEFEHLAKTDPLTGLLNRRGFLDELHRLMSNKGDFVLLSVDIDHFKAVNDTLGHDRGDALIQGVGKAIQSIITPTDFAARIGGDEFMIAMQCSAAHAKQLANSLVSNMQRQSQQNGVRHGATLSIGLAVAEHGLDLEEVLKRVDIALYGAKDQGRNCCVQYSTELRSAHDEHLSFEGELRDGMRRGEFWLAYQPVFSQRAGTITHVEALLRWTHPTRGDISPAVFIPIAERTGLIDVLGTWALETAAMTATTLPHKVGVTVNVSPHQFSANYDLIGVVDGILRLSGLAPHRLTLEITESLFLADEQAVVATLKKLRDLGVKIALDDFGTGYSSLGYLAWLPIDILKIDKNFTKEIAVSKKSHYLMRALTQLAHDLGLTIIVEGVETQEQMQAMDAFTLHGIQGFLLSPPVDKATLIATINRRVDGGIRSVAAKGTSSILKPKRARVA